MLPRVVRIAALLVVAASLAVHAQAPSRPTDTSSPPTGTSRVSGRVLTSTSEPIAGATVALALEFGGDPRADYWTTTTSADGGYQFMSLPAGRYTLVAAKEGYAGWESAAGVSVPAPAVGRFLRLPPAIFFAPFTVKHIFDLVPGGHAAELNLALRRPGSISGQIVGADGTPAVDARPTLYPANEAGLVTRAISGGKTDLNSRYVFSDVAPGFYFVGSSSALPRNLSDIDTTELVSVTVVEGRSLTNVDIRLSSHTFSLRGRVSDTLGQVPRTVLVEYGAPGSTHRGMLSVHTSDGTFQVIDSQVKAGPLTVMARGENDEGPLIGLVTVNAVDGPNEVEIIVGKPGGLVGRVTIEGSITLTSIAPRLALVREGFLPLGVNDDVIQVAPDGWFEATGLLGEYRVRVDEPQRWTVKAVRRRGLRLANDRLVVGNGDTIDALEIVIGPR